MLKYEPIHNNIEGMMPKLALETIEEEQEDFESSMELDVFSLFTNTIRADQTKGKY